MSLTHALKWSFLSELASKAISPVVFIVLARLLTPEDFGVMSAALMVMGFSQIFWEAGMGKALIQRQTDTQEAANVAFWVNIGLSIVIASLLFITAGPIARTFFHDERVTAVIQVMTLQVFLGAVSSVHTALLQKDMGFKKLFWVRFATVSLPGLASIPLALGGMGYWALVAGTLVGQLAQVIMLWHTSHWRPQWDFQIQIANEMRKFGVWVVLTGLFAWIFQWFDTLLLGMYFGIHEVGLFRVGNQLATSLFALLFSFLMPVIFSHFSSLKGNKSKMKIELFKYFEIIPIISLPIAMFILFFYLNIENILFNNKWDGVGYIFALISIKEAVLWVFANNMEAIRAIGKPKLETLASMLSAVSNIVVLYYFAQLGFHEFIFGRSIVLMILGFLIHFSLLIYVFPGYNSTYTKVFSDIFAGIVSLLGVMYISKGMSSELNLILLKILVIIIFIYTLWMINKNRLFIIIKKLQFKYKQRCD